MAKFNLYETSQPEPTTVRAAPRAISQSNLQFAGGVTLWFLLVFFVGFLILGL